MCLATKHFNKGMRLLCFQRYGHAIEELNRALPLLLDDDDRAKCVSGIKACRFAIHGYRRDLNDRSMFWTQAGTKVGISEVLRAMDKE